MEELKNKFKEILNKDKKTSNLILIVILLVILLIAINSIFNEEASEKVEAKEVISTNVTESSSVEARLSRIISKIEGVEEASVMVSYSSTEKMVPVYDTKENTDTTSDNDKTSTKKTVEKSVAYEDNGNKKSVIVESKETAEATGAIVVIKGTISENTITRIKEAVAMVTNVPLYKIQIFTN